MAKWLKSDSRFRLVSGKVTEKVKAGFYILTEDMSSSLILEPYSPTSEKIIPFTGEPYRTIYNQFYNFIDKQATYEQYGFTHKRGILLYGPPGTGKSLFVADLCNRAVKEFDAIVIYNDDCMDTFKDYMSLVQQHITDRLKIVVIEEIDTWSGQEAQMAELLESSSVDNSNTIFLATTNHIERVPAKIRDRAGRFDVKIELAHPSEEIRRIYISDMLLRYDGNIDLDKLVKYTDKLSLAAVKEFLLNMVVYKKSMQETAALFNKQEQDD